MNTEAALPCHRVVLAKSYEVTVLPQCFSGCFADISTSSRECSSQDGVMIPACHRSGATSRGGDENH